MVVSNWVAKLDCLKIPYEMLRSELGQLSDLFPKLLDILKNKSIDNRIRESLLNELKLDNVEQFKSLFDNQKSIFKKHYHFQLHELSDDDVSKIFSSISNRALIKPQSDYDQDVFGKIEEHRQKLGQEKLKVKWRESTETSSPKEWSNKHGIPILFLFEDNELDIAKTTFDILNGEPANTERVNKGLEFLSKASTLNKLRDEKNIEKLFNEKVIGKYKKIIKDVKHLNCELKSRIGEDIYGWFSKGGRLKETVEQYAGDQYKKEGYKEAIKKIDIMNPEQAKVYLKNLIMDNVDVGVAIIEDNNQKE